MAKFLEVKKCNYCKSDNSEKKFSLGEQNMVKCINCELIYLDRQRVDEEILYDEDYYKAKENGKNGFYSDYTFQEEVVKRKFNFACSYINNNFSKKSRLLEIGCGYGYFLQTLNKQINTYAVEISKKAAKETFKNNPATQVYNSDFLKVDIKDKFNFIVAFDVIEHQNDLKHFLNKVYSMLEKDGIFIFTTPDYGTIFNKIFAKHAPAVQPLYHNYYFEKKWLINNLQNLGFKIIFLRTSYFEPMNIGYILMNLYPAFPLLAKLPLLKIIRLLRIDNLIIPFFRFGGIECIVQRIEK